MFTIKFDHFDSLLVVFLFFFSYFTDLLDMSFSLSLHLLPVLSLETSVCSNLKSYTVFLVS